MGVCWNWRSNRFYIDTVVLDNMDLPPPHTPTHTIKHILYWCTNVLNRHLLSFYVSNCTCSSTICWYFLLACTCTEAPKQPSVDFSVGKYMYWTVICCYSLLASIGTQQLPVVILCWQVQVLSSHLLIFSVGKYTVLNSHMLTPSVGKQYVHVLKHWNGHLLIFSVGKCTHKHQKEPVAMLHEAPKGAICWYSVGKYMYWITKQSSADLLCWQVV